MDNNWRVTGDARRTPYAEYSETNDPPYIFFLWKPASPLRVRGQPRFDDMEQVWYFEKYTTLRTLPGFLAERRKLLDVAFFLLGPLIVALAFVPLGMRDRWVRIAVAICATMVIANRPIPWTFSHYFAPIAGLAFFLAVGRGFVALMVLFSVSVFPKRWIQQSALEPGTFEVQRRVVLEELARYGEGQLVLVRYGEGHRWNDEWVYNAADIYAAPVVWARYLVAPLNPGLISYFENRRAYVLDVDSTALLTPLRS